MRTKKITTTNLKLYAKIFFFAVGANLSIVSSDMAHGSQRKPTEPSFAEKLKAVRACAGLTAEELAKESGLGVSTIRLLESQRRPTLSPVQRAQIFNALGVDVESLLAGPFPLEWDKETPYTISSYQKWKDRGSILMIEEPELLLNKTFFDAMERLRTLPENERGVFSTILRAAMQDVFLNSKDLVDLVLQTYLQAQQGKSENEGNASEPNLSQASENTGPK